MNRAPPTSRSCPHPPAKAQCGDMQMCGNACENVQICWAGGGAYLYSQHLGGRGRQISEFKTSLVYRVSSRTASVTQRNPVSKNKTKIMWKFIKIHAGPHWPSHSSTGQALSLKSSVISWKTRIYCHLIFMWLGVPGLAYWSQNIWLPFLTELPNLFTWDSILQNLT